MKLPVILLWKGTSKPVAPHFKGQYDNAPPFPHSPTSLPTANTLAILTTTTHHTIGQTLLNGRVSLFQGWKRRVQSVLTLLPRTYLGLITAWNFQWTTVKWQFKSMRKLSDHNWNKAKKEPRFNVCHCLKQMLCLFPLAWWWKIGCEIAIAANIRLIYALRQFTANTIARTYTQLIPNIFLTVNNQLEINLLQSTFQGRTSKSLVNSSGATYGGEGESPHWQARCKKTNSDLAYISVSEFFGFQ